MSDDHFLSRWSRRKHDARAGRVAEAEAPKDEEKPGAAAPATAAPVEAQPTAPPEPLPPVESLTPESDFQPFMREGVDPKVRGQALRTLFRDPQFNVMDGLDIYIDDYSKPDPMPESWLSQLNQMGYLGDVAKTPESEGPEAPERAQALELSAAESMIESDSDLHQEVEKKQEVEIDSDGAIPTPKVE